MRITLVALLIVLGIAAIATGRFETAQLPEMRALLDGWPFWLAGVSSLIAAALLCR